MQVPVRKSAQFGTKRIRLRLDMAAGHLPLAPLALYTEILGLPSRYY